MITSLTRLYPYHWRKSDWENTKHLWNQGVLFCVVGSVCTMSSSNCTHNISSISPLWPSYWHSCNPGTVYTAAEFSLLVACNVMSCWTVGLPVVCLYTAADHTREPSVFHILPAVSLAIFLIFYYHYCRFPLPSNELL
jgi:hypothetical protein